MEINDIPKWKEYILWIDSSNWVEDRSCKIYGEVIDWVLCIDRFEYSE